jgi:DNA-binding protein HU-beta
MAQTVSTGQLIDAVAARSGLTKAEAKQAVHAVVTVVGERLGSGDRIQISGLGSFEVRERAARQATNPRTREKMQLPASKAVGFRAAAALRGQVGGRGEEAPVPEASVPAAPQSRPRRRGARSA